MAELMFETYETSAFFLSKDAVLACYACGKTSGLMVDLGASGTVTTPIQDGWAESRGVTRSPVGGRVLDARVETVLRAQQPQLSLVPLYRLRKMTSTKTVSGFVAVENTSITSQRIHPSYDAYMKLELSRDFKQTVSRTAETYLDENDPKFTNLPMIPYELPDGTMVDAGVERFQLAELLFNPSPLMKDDNRAVNDMLNQLRYTPGTATTTTDGGKQSITPVGVVPPTMTSSSSSSNNSNTGSMPPPTTMPGLPQQIGSTSRYTVNTAPLSEGISRIICDSVMRCEPEQHLGLLMNLVSLFITRINV